MNLLAERNGFVCFESCLLVRPVAHGLSVTDLRQWNEPECWLDGYGLGATSRLFFAEDVFGNQYALEKGAVIRFDVETGELEEFAPSLDSWATEILQDPDIHTGWCLGRDWQEVNGLLPLGQRLCARTPFVCGGEFTVENLFRIGEVQGMLSHANLARQIRDLPDGSEIVFKII